jgi:predicted transcriptional regulator
MAYGEWGMLLFRLSDFYLKKIENKNRTSLEIVRDILSVATERSRKTRILYDAHLNYRLLEKYLKILLENGLLKPVDNSCYLVTGKGKDFLQNYDEYLERCKKIGEEIKDARKEKLALKNMCFNNEPNSKPNAKEKLALV